VKNLLLVVAAALAWSCTRELPAGPTRGSFSISGRVIEFRTQAPLAGGRVEFTPESSTIMVSATTDAAGSYTITMPASATYVAAVNGSLAGVAVINRPSYRGDLFVNGGDCASRYGTVTDARTARPIAGATLSVAGASATSGADGWYRIDLGCPASTGFGTTLISVTHPDYSSTQRVVGRGVQGVSRLDLELEKRE